MNMRRKTWNLPLYFQYRFKLFLIKILLEDASHSNIKNV